MGLLPVLVYYASVARAGRVLAEYKNRSSNRDLAPVVVECLEQVPPLHSRFTLTIKRRIFSCLMEGPFTYCCIVDEALGKSDAFGFLEAVRDEFMLFLTTKGMSRDGEGLESVQVAAMVHRDFGSTLKVLTLPLIGVPQKEIDSLRSQASPSGVNNPKISGFDDELSPKMTQPLNSGSERSDSPSGELTRSVSRANRPGVGKSKKQQQKQQEMINRGLLEENSNGRIDIVVESSAGTSAGGGEMINHGNINNNVGSNVNNNGMVNGGNVREVGDLYPHRKSFSVREAENRWWRNVKIVLVVDVVFCVLLFVIWLGICKGFQCVS